MGEAACEPAPSGADQVLKSLQRLGLARADERPRFVPLAGGVASDIWRVDLAGGAICVKRALSRLRVEAEWRVPVERNANEVAWMETAARIVPGCVPEILGHDREAGLFAMTWLDPETHPVWKDQLRRGRADPAFAARVGDAIGRIHAGTAGDLALDARLGSDAIFHAIRLDAYLEAAARAHPELASPLGALVETTAATKRTLVHGDVSPKNILVGPGGPVFLDAECAWYGDPAFDLAFCLNHLLLKCLWVPEAAPGFLACFDALAAGYMAHVGWEPAAEVEVRAARLLPGLFLARADGKSPAEYLTERDKDRVRAAAGGWLGAPMDRLGDIRGAWAREGLS